MFIQARDLNEAWFLVLKSCFENGKQYMIEKGSFEGHTRYQLPSLSLEVIAPDTRPLAPLVRQGFEPPTTEEYIETYFSEYIMNPHNAPNEEYSYGEFIYPHLDSIIKMLTKTPHTNHAVVNIGEPFGWKEEFVGYADDGGKEYAASRVPMLYENPPCLRCITWQYNNDDTIDIHTFWRSWDVYSGLPTNLGGLQLLNEYIAYESNHETGKLYAYSSGAHVYDYCKDAIDAWVR